MVDISGALSVMDVSDSGGGARERLSSDRDESWRRWWLEVTTLESQVAIQTNGSVVLEGSSCFYCRSRLNEDGHRLLGREHQTIHRGRLLPVL